MKIKIGFAITTYDKFEEAEILIDILRECFKEEYPIALCSNHPAGEDFARRMNIKYYIQGEDIAVTPVGLKRRTLDTIMKSCTKAMEMPVDYIIHTHSDGWVLDEEAIRKLVAELKLENKALAIRGFGDTYEQCDRTTIGKYHLIEGTPFGHVDDHFFVFNKKKFLEKKVFDFEPTDFSLYRHNIHDVLATVFLVKLGLKDIWYYGNTAKMTGWNGKPMVKRGVKPSIYDDDYKTLHVHRGSFKNGYGQQLQAWMLQNHNLNKTEFIKEFIRKYGSKRLQLEVKLSGEEIRDRIRRIILK